MGFSAAFAAKGPTPPTRPASSTRAAEPVTLNFSNAEIEAVARAMAAISGVNVVVDPRVKGTLTLTTDKPVSRSQALDQFLAALRLQGYTMVESAGLYKVVPESDAKLQSGSVTPNEPGAPAGSQITTQIFKLNFESANNLLPVLRPLISPNNTINVSAGNNALVITDYADNLRRLARIIAAMDVSNATDVDVLPLKYAIASDIAPLVQRLLESTGGTPATADAGFRTTLVAESRSNTLIVRAANVSRLALARALVQRLDQPDSGSGASGNIHVVYLKNAEATKVAATLRAAMGAGAVASTTPAAGGAAPTPAAVSNTGGQVQADPATNALIITAPEPQYRQLRAVIDQLDVRRAQVFVESLIAEVSADKASEIGIQWQSALGQSGDTNVGYIGTNYGTGSNNNIVNISNTAAATGAASVARGFNFGLAHKTNGIYVLGLLAQFLEDSGSGNVLSTPNLLTLDNEEAKIVIGQNVPFVTGQFTNTNASSNGTVNPFQTIERKDVGLTLRVKPQISENGTVRLSIYQEVSSVLASSINAVNGPTTNKRTIESNVLVDDGAIVVLGGLLQDEYSSSREKVPGLGDLPVLGALFRSDSRSRKKTNLMVFLRPVVVRDAAASTRLSLDRYELMRSDMQGGTNTTEAPLLPKVTADSPIGAPAGVQPQAAPASAPASKP